MFSRFSVCVCPINNNKKLVEWIQCNENFMLRSADCEQVKIIYDCKKIKKFAAEATKQIQ